jgi:hypothetical protein
VTREISPVYADDLLVQEARDLHLAANGFYLRDYEAPTFTIRIFGLSLKFPNAEAHKRAVPLHDLHHLVTGYRTDWVGEAEIGAWELRGGCNSFITYFLNGSGVVIGSSSLRVVFGEPFKRRKGSALSTTTQFLTTCFCK